jgi:ribosome-binding factor A
MPTQRQLRVQELLKQEVSRILQFELRDPRLGFVTVTDVEVSPDLRYARVFVSVYGDQKAVSRSMERLRASTGFVRGVLGHSIELRYTPELTFVHDTSVARAARIAELLRQIEEETPREERAGADEDLPDA